MTDGRSPRTPMRYSFRPVANADLILLETWRTMPHVVKWWGEPHVEPDVEKLADARIAMWIVEYEGRPFAFRQDYAPHDWHPHPFAHLPPGSRGIDQYIGTPEMIGRGHGTNFVRQHCERLFSMGVPAIGTDPHPDNARAIRAYQNAGFLIRSEPLETRLGRAVLMERWAND